MIRASYTAAFIGPILALLFFFLNRIGSPHHFFFFLFLFALVDGADEERLVDLSDPPAFEREFPPFGPPPLLSIYPSVLLLFRSLLAAVHHLINTELFIFR